ncbi:MAG: hypothetical protein F2768_05385 [Actinobacteria bacterium]|uniref:Unannotated protein n=1 Tax=freshwater metagenome TaxID=449393 RepID=A0A6J7BHY1_9ZZZZ|nr:hypothetical protein [Actinomycetota bacterium]
MRFVIMVPRGLKTGGPECLHQLHFTLLSLGHQSCLLAAPGSENSQPSPDYESYLPRYISAGELVRSDILVVPEYLKSIPKSMERKVGRVVLWWLSVDYSPHFKGNMNSTKVAAVTDKWIPQEIGGSIEPHKVFRLESLRKVTIRKLIRYFYSKVLSRIDEFNSVDLPRNNSISAYQSEYARRNVLERFGVEGLILTDYVKDIDFRENGGDSERFDNRPLISFNGNKGFELVQQLQRQLQDKVDFLLLKSFTRSELLEIFLKSDLYLDLGHFPGKDRMPREALKAGCPILISRFGAAENEIDFAIPAEYKLDLENLDAESAAAKVLEILSLGRQSNLSSQENYRKFLFQDKEKFIREVEQFITFCEASLKSPILE